MYAVPGLNTAQIGNYYKDATFGVKPVGRRADLQPALRRDDRPRPVRRAAHLRLDPGRRDVRCRLRGRRGPPVLHRRAPPRRPRRPLHLRRRGNVGMDESVWADTPYTEAELQQQYDQADEVYGARGALIQSDVQSYVEGVNKYIDDACVNPLIMPGEYALIGKPNYPCSNPWKVTDVISIASLVAGIFGKGGGGELSSALVLEALQKKFGPKQGQKVWADFRSQNDPEAPTTVHHKRFPYETHSEAPARRRDAGSRLGQVRERGERQGRSDQGRQGGGERRRDPRRGRPPGAASPAHRRFERAPRVGARVQERAPAGRVRPAGLLLHAADPDGGGAPRRRPRTAPRRSTPAARPSRAPTSTSSSDTAETTPGARRRRGRTSSTPTR